MLKDLLCRIAPTWLTVAVLIASAALLAGLVALLVLLFAIRLTWLLVALVLLLAVRVVTLASALVFGWLVVHGNPHEGHGHLPAVVVTLCIPNCSYSHDAARQFRPHWFIAIFANGSCEWDQKRRPGRRLPAWTLIAWEGRGGSVPISTRYASARGYANHVGCVLCFSQKSHEKTFPPQVKLVKLVSW